MYKRKKLQNRYCRFRVFCEGQTLSLIRPCSGFCDLSTVFAKKSGVSCAHTTRDFNVQRRVCGRYTEPELHCRHVLKKNKIIDTDVHESLCRDGTVCVCRVLCRRWKNDGEEEGYCANVTLGTVADGQSKHVYHHLLPRAVGLPSKINPFWLARAPSSTSMARR